MMCGYMRETVIPNGKIWENPGRWDLSSTVKLGEDLVRVKEHWKTRRESYTRWRKHMT